MEPHQELDPLVTRNIDVARRPHVLPCRTVALERFVKVQVPQRQRPGLDQGVARGRVVRGEEGHELLDAHRRPLAHVEREHLLDVVVHLVERAIRVELNAGGEHACAGGFTDVHVRLSRLDLQRDDLGAEGPRADARDVAALELVVTRHAAVHHATVDRRDDLHPAGPVLGLEGPLEPGMVHVGHAHEPPAPQRRLPPGPVAEAQCTHDHRVPDVELVPVLEQLHLPETHRVLTVDAQLQHEPVGEVHQVLVQHRPPPEDRRLAVVDAVGVGARIVDGVCVLPFCGAARAEIPVARRGQSLAQALLDGLESLVGQREPVQGARLSPVRCEYGRGVGGCQRSFVDNDGHSVFAIAAGTASIGLMVL